MRNAPSFIGEFPSKHKPKRCSSPPSELQIEKEANLREKKKKILQRLKKHVDQGDAFEKASQPVPPIEEVPKKVIFSPRTSKKFHQATQQLAGTTTGNEIKRLDKPSTPLIVLQKAEKELGNTEDTKRRQGYDHGRKASRKLDLSAESRNEDERVLPYIPSFTEKPKRLLVESLSPVQKQIKVPKSLNPKKKTDLEVSSSRYTNQKESNKDHKSSKELPLIVTEKVDTNIEFSLSDDDSVFDPYTGYSFRRSASFHSLKDRHQEQGRHIRTSAGKRRQFLKVDDYNFMKASSLSSLYDEPSPSGGSEGELSISSTSFAKQQQQKLEEDFHRVEENLNRAFSELRKYLRTS